jgi:hypothetical protein
MTAVFSCGALLPTSSTNRDGRSTPVSRERSAFHPLGEKDLGKAIPRAERPLVDLAPEPVGLIAETLHGREGIVQEPHVDREPQILEEFVLLVLAQRIEPARADLGAHHPAVIGSGRDRTVKRVPRARMKALGQDPHPESPEPELRG